MTALSLTLGSGSPGVNRPNCSYARCMAARLRSSGALGASKARCPPIDHLVTGQAELGSFRLAGAYLHHASQLSIARRRRAAAILSGMATLRNAIS